MTFVIRAMSLADARTVAAWRYPEPYDFYDADADPEDLEELLRPDTWAPNSHFAVLDQAGGLAGFLTLDYDGSMVTVGLGLRPDLTGRGIGEEFIKTGLRHAVALFNPGRFVLQVALFNRRAIRVYERVGFAPQRVFWQRTNGGRFQFLEMAADASAFRL